MKDDTSTLLSPKNDLLQPGSLYNTVSQTEGNLASNDPRELAISFSQNSNQSGASHVSREHVQWGRKYNFLCLVNSPSGLDSLPFHSEYSVLSPFSKFCEVITHSKRKYCTVRVFNKYS